MLRRKKAAVTITDPQYKIAYTSGKWFRNDKLREDIEGDEQSPEGWSAFMGPWRLPARLLGPSGCPSACRERRLFPPRQPPRDHPSF